jgi:hypothetical protein
MTTLQYLSILFWVAVFGIANMAITKWWGQTIMREIQKK